MKKTLFAALLVAAVAVLATSCNKKSNDPSNPGGGSKDAPLALFEYSVADFDVTFKNLSEGADSYSWNFGDGSAASTEANPTHTYSKTGRYLAVLTATNANGSSEFSDSIFVQYEPVKIDGKFTDWDKLLADTASGVVSTKLEAGVPYYRTAIDKFAAYMDANYIYFMLAYRQDSVMPLDLFLGCSGERDDTELPGGPCTSYWDPIYVDYLVEFGKGDSFDPNNMDWYNWRYSTLFEFNRELGGWEFNELKKGEQTVSVMSDKVVIDGLTYVECKMSRVNFPMEKGIDYVYICCNTSDSEWSGIATGIAPAATNYDEIVEYQPQLKLKQAPER